MILAVDPGNEKTGVALVQKDKTLVAKFIFKTIVLEENIVNLLKAYPSIKAIVCGNGTNHKHLYPLLESISNRFQKKIVLINEAYTTEEARKRYWDFHKPKGWKKILPKGMLYPPEAVDDITAWIIGERYLEETKNNHKKQSEKV